MLRILTIPMLVLCGALAALPADQKPPAPKSQGELEALRQMLGAQDPDARIKAAENLLSKYADTDYKGLAFYVEATAYQQQNDYDKMIVYAEQAVKADPKQYAAMLILATGIAQRTREFDLDREEKLARAEKYAKDAIEIVKDTPKPNAQITDEQWTQAKNDYLAQGHEALGYAARARKNYDVAISELKQAVDLSPTSVTMIQLAVTYDQAKKPDEAIPLLEKVMAMPDVPASIKQYAQAEKVRATQLKSAGAQPVPTPAPPQVEIKKQ
jgi:tetratricopeptide (TPR) repeat protein